MLLCVIALSVSGCSLIPTRTIYVPPGRSVRLRQDIKNVKIWIKDAKGEVRASTLTLKEGWFVMSMEDAK